jgi:tRNA U55 pseudouridine synthase TruB
VSQGFETRFTMSFHVGCFDSRLWRPSANELSEKLKVAAELPNGVRTFRQRLEKINEIELKTKNNKWHFGEIEISYTTTPSSIFIKFNQVNLKQSQNRCPKPQGLKKIPSAKSWWTAHYYLIVYFEKKKNERFNCQRQSGEGAIEQLLLFRRRGKRT